MTLELTDQNQTLLQEAAASTHRSESDLANEAMDWYFASLVAVDAEHRAKIARAREQIARGETTPHEEVFASLKQRLGW